MDEAMNVFLFAWLRFVKNHGVLDDLILLCMKHRKHLNATSLEALISEKMVLFAIFEYFLFLSNQPESYEKLANIFHFELNNNIVSREMLLEYVEYMMRITTDFLFLNEKLFEMFDPFHIMDDNTDLSDECANKMAVILHNALGERI
eukprot:CAMPEP_0171528886 /NCGR_PEP_ID=MMETSP0959-20130129/11958_1 /TAXON_ID=87120 /ORGANISM="Aurantiochytrium limacinum, Strain ATCCMYA-1381" /LENGTH=146 /DNA_ID=CAMNT_0012070991 /DNA_START=73 /DNA_END=510 /DNA_ORIENTATION=+